MELSIFSHYFFKMACTLKAIVTKPPALIACLPAVTLPILTTPQKALLFLAFLFLGDFITGILASWVEFKKAAPLVPASGKRYLIQSAKLRLSGVKFICYVFIILGTWGVEMVFYKEKIPVGKINTDGLTLTTIGIAFCCGIEAYSIFFENFKRMGFDLADKIKSISKELWKLFKSVKGNDDETN